MAVTDDSGFIGKTADEIGLEYGMSVIVILRGELTVVPQSVTKVERGDILVVRSRKILK